MSIKNEQHEFIVAHNSQSIEAWLSGRLMGLGKQQLETLFHQGRIKLNDRVALPTDMLLKGDRIALQRRFFAEIVPEALPLNIIFEDEDLLVVNKPSGMPVHPGLGHYKGTVLNALAHYYIQTGQDAPIKNAIVHRLDKDTSGLMVLAKSLGAKDRLASDFREGRIHRKYEALVWGKPKLAEGSIKIAVGRIPGERHQLGVDPNGTWGKSAITNYKVVKSGQSCSMVEIAPQTGRTHQIRIHFHHLEHPLVGDKRYFNADQSMFDRLYLHASQISLKHPNSLLDLTFHCDSGFDPF